MFRSILIVGAGGFIGSVMRYIVQVWVDKGAEGTFPWGTLIANVAGSFIIGVVFALAERGNWLSTEWKIFLAVGICGGFTTFSAFALNNLSMLKANALHHLAWNVGGSLVLGVLAVYLGILLVKMV